MSHTHRPWRTEAVSDAVRIVVGHGRDKVILARLNPPQLPEAETHANALLMASAPDLLEALKLAQRALNEMGRALPQGEGLADYCTVLDTAEAADLAASAAIAKAEGGS